MSIAHLQNLSEQLETVLTEQQTTHDGSHDVYHARRVKQNALAIAQKEAEGNERILVAAAYLHDLVNVPKNDPNRHHASRLSAEAATHHLAKLNFNDEEIKAISHCIEAHSFSAGIEPITAEARIIQDADRLESLGALGIARTFYIAGKLDSDLFDGADPFAEHRSLDDKCFAIDHFKLKLLTLADTMKTESGKVIALERTASMRAFLDAFANEVGVAQSW